MNQEEYTIWREDGTGPAAQDAIASKWDSITVNLSASLPYMQTTLQGIYLSIPLQTLRHRSASLAFQYGLHSALVYSPWITYIMASIPLSFLSSKVKLNASNSYIPTAKLFLFLHPSCQGTDVRW